MGELYDLSTADVARFLEIITGLPEGADAHIEITRWEGDSLTAVRLSAVGNWN